MTRTTMRAALLASLGLGILAAAADTRGQVAIKARRDVDAAAPANAPSKLAPELEAARVAGGTFVGARRTGEAVVNLPAGVNLAKAKQQWQALGNIDAMEIAPAEQVDPIGELIVVMNPAAPAIAAAPDAQPGPAEAAPAAAADAPKEVAGLAVTERHVPGQFVVVRSEGGFDAKELTNLANDPNVRYVEPNYVYRIPDEPKPRAAAPGPQPPPQTPNDPRLRDLWGMRNINAAAAWGVIHDTNVLVAVIDTGVDYKHEDLQKNMWINPSDSADGNDNDNNGLTDDVHGADFTNNDGDPMDTHSHGTHCAGTVAAVGDNEKGVVGVNWHAPVMAIQMLNPSATASNIAKGIDYAANRGAKVLSNSWGGGAYSQAIKDAIARAEGKGALFVAAAGNGYGNDNDTNPVYPASYDNANIIAVASISENDTLSDFSNVGATKVHIAAPGDMILSTMPNNGYATKSGTSMATPHVAGAAALIWSHPAHRSSSPAQIKDLILRNARGLPTLKGKCATGGTLDLQFLAGAGGGGGGAPGKGAGAAAPAPPATAAASKEVTIQGTLEFPTFEIGGETTGAKVTTKDRTSVELDVRHQKSLEQAMSASAGKEVIVTGELTTQRSPETGERKILKVDEIKPAE